MKPKYPNNPDLIDELIRNAIEAERKACAQVCIDICNTLLSPSKSAVAKRCAEAIEARGKK